MIQQRVRFQSSPHARFCLHAAALAAWLVIGGCSARHCSNERCATAATQRWLKTELYFGLAQADGSKVTAVEWQEFVDAYLTPAFPDGLTVVDAAGQWRNEQGAMLKEQSKLVIILHPPDSQSEEGFRRAITEYKRRFKQQSVLRTTQRAVVSFE